MLTISQFNTCTFLTRFFIAEFASFALTLSHTSFEQYSNNQTFRIIDYLISFNRAQEKPRAKPMRTYIYIYAWYALNECAGERKKSEISTDRISIHFQSIHMQESHAFFERFIVVTATTLYCCAFSSFLNIKMCCISICASNRRSQNNSCHLLCSYKILKNHTKPSREKMFQNAERERRKYGLVFAYAVAQNPQ